MLGTRSRFRSQRHGTAKTNQTGRSEATLLGLGTSFIASTFSFAPNAPNAPLTQREMEVLRLVANGLSEREVADKLFISPHTAHRHLSNIRLKLNVATQAAAVAHAARIGLI